jgi:hypothetical protein
MIMKKILRIIRNVLLVLIGLFISICLFLLIYYSIQAKAIRNKQAALEQQPRSQMIQADSIITNPDQVFLNLIPVPRKYQMQEGTYKMPATLTFTATDTLQLHVSQFLTLNGFDPVFSEKKADLVVQFREDLHEQGYNLSISPTEIVIDYTDIQGLYYAFVTLKVLNHNYNGNIPALIIEDFPDIPVRGLMLDISRDKVPSLKTLKQIAELIGDLKYNHFELYVEGFSFAYPGFRNLWEGRETPVTGQEIQELDSFCTKRYIDLVPNQNSFGHMTAWLATDEFSHLAECPDGYKLFGLVDMKGTLDPSNPQSIELVTKMTDDLLPNFSSDKFNVNLDEPFELGKGKSKELAEKNGVGQIYLDYALKIHKMVKARGKQMLMWGDVILRHPDILNKIPEDITLLDWGYAYGYPFEKNCKTLKAHGVNYMVCPGTSSWTSITGLTDNMLGNIASAASNGVKYNTAGLLLTDWGDMGHWQYLPVSYPGYIVGSALSWNSNSSDKLPLVPFLNNYIFKDSRLIMGDLVLDLGRYNTYEEIPLINMTSTMMSLQFGLQDEVMLNALYDKLITGLTELMKDLIPELAGDYKIKYKNRQSFDFSGMFAFLDEKEALLNNADMKVKDSLLIKSEYLNALRLIRTGVNLQFYIKNRKNLNGTEEKVLLLKIQSTLKQYLSENERLWNLRNSTGGYRRSIKALENLSTQIENQLGMLEKPFYIRGLKNIKERLVTAAAVLYFKYMPSE